MPDWLVEQGIGELRAARIADGAIAEARIFIDGITRAGARLEAQLIENAPRAIARASDGDDYLLPHGAGSTPQGSRFTIEVTREKIAGAEPWKRPLAKVVDDQPGRAPALPDHRDLPFPSHRDELANAGWNDLLDEARSGKVAFPGGELHLSPTPAMTLIDVDGYLPPAELAGVGAKAAVAAILRLDIGGSIGIDFPTIAGKSDRHSVGAVIDAQLPKPFERTAVNGFGFLQIVRPRLRGSLIEMAQDSAMFEARALLRRAAFDPPGSKRLVANPAVIGALEDHPDWLAALSRQVGGAVGLRVDAALPMSGGYAEPE